MRTSSILRKALRRSSLFSAAKTQAKRTLPERPAGRPQFLPRKQSNQNQYGTSQATRSQGPTGGKSQSGPTQEAPGQPSNNEAPPQPPSMSSVLAKISPENNSLLAPVHISEDPLAVLKSDHPATNILAQSGIVVQRELEMWNVIAGFEQANRYVILDPQGNHIGHIAEHDGGIGKALGRQWFRTHRAFMTHVFDKEWKEVLRFHRPFSWINSRIRVYDPLELSSNLQTSASTSLTPSSSSNSDPADLRQISSLPLNEMRVIGETHSEWAPLRRKYNLFLARDNPDDSPPSQAEPISSISPTKPGEPSFVQFAAINSPFLSWDFELLNSSNQPIGAVNRGFRGFAREIFTDTGSYALRMDSVALDELSNTAEKEAQDQRSNPERGFSEAVGATGTEKGMTLDQRAVMLATAVTVDFDYFSRHSHAGGMGFMPIWMGGGGGEAAGGAAAGGAAGGAAEAGAVVGAGEAGGAVAGAAGQGIAGGAAGAGEGAIAGAGTMAGYEAMQRGMGRRGEGEQAGSEGAGVDGQGYASGGDAQSPYGDPDSPQYGQGHYGDVDPQSGFGQEQGSGDVWGNEQDPWAQESSPGGSGGGGDGEGGGWISQLWDSFFGD